MPSDGRILRKGMIVSLLFIPAAAMLDLVVTMLGPKDAQENHIFTCQFLLVIEHDLRSKNFSRNNTTKLASRWPQLEH
jgi:hypothetical protein